MANENDEVHQQQSHRNNSSIGDAMGVAALQFVGGVGGADEGDDDGGDGAAQSQSDQKNKSEQQGVAEAIGSRGKLNDLVADLCLNGVGGGRAASATIGAFGDYTNIRATLGSAADNVQPTASALSQNSTTTTSSSTSSFSFKHFLNSSSANPAPSSTVTSLDPIGGGGSVSNTLQNTTTAAFNALQTSTGARPKVPQSASASATSITSLAQDASSSSAAATAAAAAAASKMKRSPRFSSFDSQASLAEYAGASECGGGLDCGAGMSSTGGGGSSTGFRLYPEGRVVRSFSNYDMPPMSSVSQRRRMGFVTSSADAGAAKETRPTRLALNTNAAAAACSSKLKLDLPIDNAANTSARPSMLNNAGGISGDFPPPPAAAVAAALPDFVQDHWMESWYAHEMYLHSPPNSPVCDFVEELTAGTASSSSAVTTAAGGEVDIAAASTDAASASSKMLPDFLSDGPIIHSSQRLADVATGLPSNSMGSPEDPPAMSSHLLSRLRIENERLQHELNESRSALNEQTRRSAELERQLQERQRSDSAYSRSMSQNITLVEESLDKSKRRTAAAQNHVTKLKQQVTQLTAEVETLRRENEVLREEGAVGGVCSAPLPSSSCDRSYIATATAAEAAGSGAASGGGARANVTRPSRTQQLSRDLLKAASNAENNLRQLLTGVDNLRQIAADIENSEMRLDYDVSPDLFSDFLDECDDYEEYPPGGPAL